MIGWWLEGSDGRGCKGAGVEVGRGRCLRGQVTEAAAINGLSWRDELFYT